MKKLLIFFLAGCLTGFSIACSPGKTTGPYVKVFKYDGSIQCESKGISLDIMARELSSIGIDISCRHKGHDGLMRPAVCGAGTGSMNIYKISRTRLNDALKLGFKPVTEVLGYKDTICKTYTKNLKF